MQKLTRELIEDRLKNFWGYGTLEAKTWFVGMEEGLNKTTDTEEIGERFKIAEGKAMVDMRGEMMRLSGHAKWFLENAPVQATWKYPIELYLQLEKRRERASEERKEEIREHQIHVLGNPSQAATATVELMPLPANKTDEDSWLYGGHGIPHLEIRAEYLKYYRPARIDGLRRLVHEHNPSRVIFYSTTYLPFWEDVTDVPLQEITKQMYFGESGATKFYVIPQAQSFGMSYKRLYEFIAGLN